MYVVNKIVDRPEAEAYSTRGRFILDQWEILKGQYEDGKDTERDCLSAGMGVAP